MRTARHKPTGEGKVRGVTYELMVKSIDGAATAAPDDGGGNPTLVRRPSTELDHGRPWSGDEYIEGEVSDPADAIAHFTLPGEVDPATGQTSEDTEAWMDRSPDGTLTGWVRDGADVYRYSDPDAWALDVDGAQMQRVDGGDDLAADAEAEAPIEGDPAEEATETPAVEDEEGVDLPPDEDDEEFDNPFAEEAPEAEADGDTTQLTDANGEPVDPDADPEPVADPPDPDPKVGAPADQPAEPGSPEDPAVPTQAQENPESEEFDQGVRDPARDRPEPEAETEEDRLFKKRGETKNAPLLGIRPGPRRFEFKAHFAGECDSDSGDKEPSPSGDTRPSTPPRPTPKQASLHPDTLGRLSDEDLAALANQGDLYDHDTLMAVAQERDSRSSVDSDVRDLFGDAPPRSPERAAAFDAVIPEQWLAWAATRSKVDRNRNKKQQIEDGYHDYLLEAIARAEASPMVNGRFWNAKYINNPPFDPMELLTGRRRGSLRKYASEELQMWLAENPVMTLTAWLAEFYPSYEKLFRQLSSAYISEWG